MQSPRWYAAIAFLVLAGCGGGGGGGSGAGSETPPPDSDSTAPTATVSPVAGSTLTAASSISILFSESMTRSSISIGGTGASGVVKTWSTTTVTDDTLTLTGSWVDGDSKTITIDGSDTSSNSMTQVSLNYHILGDDAVYVATTGDDSNSGTHDAPMQTLAAGLTARSSLSLSEVRVAKGSYSSAGVGVSSTLKGGYDASDWTATRDLTQNATVITNTSTANGSGGTPNAAVVLSGGATIDGFTIHGASTAVYSAGVSFDGSSEATVSNCFIDGGAGSTASYGIFIGTSYGNSLFTDNTVDAGTSPGIQHGIHMGFTQTTDFMSSSTITASGGIGCSEAMAVFSGSANGMSIYQCNLTGGQGTTSAGFFQFQNSFSGYRGAILSCTIDGGAGTTSYGVRLYKDVLGGTTIVLGNTIYGGNGTTTTGISVSAVDDNRPYVIMQNKVHGGTASGTATGISHNIAAATIADNAVFGGVADISRGISILQSASPYYPDIWNNTINGGNATTSSSAIYAVYYTSPVANNILMTSGGAARYALDYWVQGGTAEYNAYVDTSTVLLHTRWNCGTACLDYNTLVAIHAQLDGDDVDYLDSVDAIDFTDGTDPDATWSVTDYSLANTSSSNVKSGGLDGDAEGWDFTVDLTGATRTGSGGFGWSIGAYEN